MTTSGSGLDPDISPEAALFPGAARCQGAQHAGRSTCASSSTEHIEGRTLGLLGEPRVNVLALNLASIGAGTQMRRGRRSAA